MPCTIASPIPEPLPTGLVVKNGSNIRSRTASLTPLPLSATDRTTQRPRNGARHEAQTPSIDAASRPIRIAPAPPMASRALMQRLKSTCSICTESPTTAGAAASSAVCSSTELGKVERSSCADWRSSPASDERAPLAALAPREGEHLRDQVARALRGEMRLAELAHDVGRAEALGALARQHDVAGHAGRGCC